MIVRSHPAYIAISTLLAAIYAATGRLKKTIDQMWLRYYSLVRLGWSGEWMEHASHANGSSNSTKLGRIALAGDAKLSPGFSDELIERQQLFPQDSNTLVDLRWKYVRRSGKVRKGLRGVEQSGQITDVSDHNLR